MKNDFVWIVLVGVGTFVGLKLLENTRAKNEDAAREAYAAIAMQANIAKRQENLNRQLEKMVEYASKIREREDFFEAVLALAAIGFAAANCDGMVTKGQNEVIIPIGPVVDSWGLFKR